MVCPDRITLRSGRRGAALLLVLVFGLMAMALVLTLLQLSDVNVRGQAEFEQQLQLHCIIRAGIADSVAEINATRLDPPPDVPDPGGDGIGARTVDPIDGLRGIAVRSPAGRVLGRYCATIDPVGGGSNRLTVVAAYPDFARPRNAVVARVEIARGQPPFPANAISLTGDTLAGYDPGNPPRAALEMQRSGQIYVRALEFDVPAVNVTDAAMYADVTQPHNASLVDGADVLVGADPNNPGASATGAATVTNLSAGMLSQTTMNEIAEGINAFCIDHPVGMNGTVDFKTALLAVNAGAVDAANRMTGSVTLPTGIYRMTHDMEVKGTITGSGTLIIGKQMLISNGQLNWTGDVIVQSDDAKLFVKGGVDVTGVLALQAIGSTATIFADNGCQITANGALAVLADLGADLVVSGGAKIDVIGVMALMGQDIGFDIGSGGHIAVTGSLAIAVPDGADVGISKIKIGNGGHGDFGFDQGQFQKGINVLGSFFDPAGKLLPISVKNYWEVGAGIQDPTGAYRTQQARIDAGGNVGMPP